MSIGIIVKRYEHINRSFGNWDTPKGKYISTRKQYENEMKKGGFVPYDPNMPDKPARKEYKLSEEKMKFLHRAKDRADRKGNIEVNDGWIKELQANKVLPKDLNYYKKLPSVYNKGGFENAS